MRTIFEFSADNAKIADWLAERGGFEPPVPRGFIWAEFGPRLAHYSARKKASVLKGICSPGIRLCFGSLRSASFARPMRGIVVMPNVRRGLRVQISSSLGGQSATQLCLFGIARGGVRAGGGAGVVCGAVSPATENEQTVKEGEDLSSRTARLRNWLARTETIDRASVSMPATLRR